MYLEEFDRLFESLKNWGCWGPDDERGTLNYITKETVLAAARLVESGLSVSMEFPSTLPPAPTTQTPQSTTWAPHSMPTWVQPMVSALLWTSWGCGSTAIAIPTLMRPYKRRLFFGRLLFSR